MSEDGASPERSDLFPGELITGANALTWSRRLLPVLIAYVAVGAALVGQIGGVWGGHDTTVFWSVCAVWVLFGVCTMVGLAAQATQDVRESRRGYTTQYNTRRQLPQIDPETRRILRAPGAPYITAPRRRRR